MSQHHHQHLLKKHQNKCCSMIVSSYVTQGQGVARRYYDEPHNPHFLQSYSAIRFFPKAFGNIDHTILLQTISCYGMNGLILSCFKSYLYNITQCAKHMTVKCDIPQGSILGLLFVKHYINGLCNKSAIMKFCRFADDISLFLSNKK